MAKRTHDEPYYDTDAHAEPAAPPPAPELFSAFSTDELRRLRNDLRSHIPSDPTHTAAVSRVLGHLLALDIAHPDRQQRDEEFARQVKAAQQKAAADLVAKQEAEQATAG